MKQDCESGGEDVFAHIDIVISMHNQIKISLISNAEFATKLKLLQELFTNNFLKLFGENLLTWPPLLHIVAIAASFMLKDMLFSLRFFNLAYFIILIISIYLIGRKIHSPAVGIISAYLVSFYPAVFGFTRKFGLDFPLTAISACLIYLLLKCNNFRNLKYSLLFGFVRGLAKLIKMQIIFFVIGPFGYIFLCIIKDKQNRWELFRNIIISFSLGVLISLIWWYRLISIKGIDMLNTHFLFRHPQSSFISGSFLDETIYYLKAVYMNIFPFFFFLFLTGLFILLLKNIAKEKGLMIIFLWFIIPYIIFSLIPTKHDRYIFPVLGAVSLITVIGLLELPFKINLNKIGLLFVIFFGICQYSILSYCRNYCFLDDYYPLKNNHKTVVNKFEQIIANSSRSPKITGIIEEEYFLGDKAIRLGYFLKAISGNNLPF